MQDNNNILASSINAKDHLTVFDTMIKARIDSIDLTPILMYLIDIAPVAALPYLADQFDVMGFNGWILCDNDDERRSLIRRSIELKRFRGTPWAIKEALKSVGYYDAQIQEGFSGHMYDGTILYDGTYTYGEGNWANFRVSLLDLGESKGFSTATLALIIGMINAYKNERSNLLDIVLKATTIDYFDTIDDSDFVGSVNLTNDEDQFNVTHYYDGTYNHNGNIYYAADTSIFELNIGFPVWEDVFNLPDDSDFIIKIIPLGGTTLIGEDNFQLIGEDGSILIDESTVESYVGP
jgi:hypothetical protein